jgi:hypothetical protein
VIEKEAESRKLELVNRFILLCDDILDLAAGDGVYFHASWGGANG